MELGSFAPNSPIERQIVLSGPIDAANTATSLAGLFDGSETFRVTLWRGEDEADVWTADDAVAWDADATTDPATGEAGSNPADFASPVLLLTIPRATVAAIGSGTFYVEILINPEDADSVSVLPDGAYLEIRPAAGDAAAIPVYCSFDDVRDVAEWIGSVAGRKSTARADLAEQRGEARKWAERTFLARAEESLRRQASAHGAVVYSAPILPTTGTDYGPDWGLSTIPDTTIRDQLAAIQGYLDADKLIVSDGLRRATALFTIFLVCRPLVGSVPGTTTASAQAGTSYQEMAKACREEAKSLLVGVRAEIDSDDDGIADIWIR